MIARAIVLFFAAVTLGACVAAPQGAVPGTPGGTAPPPAMATETLPAGPPVDTTIEPVSATAPSPEAAEVLEACQARDFGLDRVAGMGLVPRARDVPKYTRLVGVEPEIHTDRPAWVITFRGILRLGARGSALRGGRRDPVYAADPTCVVIDGVPFFYLTGPAGTDPDNLTVPPIEVGEPSLALPPLAP